MRTFCQRAMPLGRLGPFMPGEKSRLDTILRVVWMSNTQCAAVSTCRVPIKLPVHSSALHGHNPHKNKAREIVRGFQVYAGKAPQAMVYGRAPSDTIGDAGQLQQFSLIKTDSA